MDDYGKGRLSVAQELKTYAEKKMKSAIIIKRKTPDKYKEINYGGMISALRKVIAQCDARILKTKAFKNQKK